VPRFCFNIPKYIYKGAIMSKALFLFIAGIFVGAAIYELSKRSNNKWQFTHLLENLVEKEADDIFISSFSKREDQFMADLKEPV
jgi:ABC-type Fe3+-hydroxamate transport system substrate-binding protein